MTPPAPSTPSNDQFSLSALAPHARQLAAALETAGVAADRIPAVFARGLNAVCAQCGGRITGEELHALVPTTVAPLIQPRIERIRHGYCPRTDCSSYYCRLEYTPVEGVDWARLLSGEPEAEAAAEAEAEAAATQMRQARTAKCRLMLKIAAGVAGILLLFLARQWQTGGTIPFLREPEKFQVDPASLDRAGQD